MPEINLPHIEISEDAMSTKNHFYEASGSTSLSRPKTFRTNSMPQNADATRLRACTMGASMNNLKTLHDSGAMTPPATPTEISSNPFMERSYFPSAAAISPNQLSSHQYTSQPDNSASVLMLTGSLQEGMTKHEEEPGSTKTKVFPYWIHDYECGEKGKRKLLGTGLWSDVYLAVPSLSLASSSSYAATTPSPSGITTPPITPIHSREPSFSIPTRSTLPSAYAIKIPASRTAKRVLAEEAKVLSYLSDLTGFSTHVVDFYGQDIRNEALVMKAMDMTLEHWVCKHLNTLSEDERRVELTSVFPELSRALVDGLLWLRDSDCTHSDIKPSNILLSTMSGSHAILVSDVGPTPSLRAVVFSDFSSATLTAGEPGTNISSTENHSAPSTKPAIPLSGGTWDFLDPALLVSHNAPSPSANSDLWALAITLLFVVIGCSPFDGAGTNVFRRRECVKQGAPLAYAGCGEDGLKNMKRFDGLGKDLGWDVKRWLGRVLKRDLGTRIEIEEWKMGMGMGVFGGL